MIDKLFRRSSQQIIEMEEQLDKMMSADTNNTPEDYLGPFYQKIELIMDQIVKIRGRRQFIVNNLISDIGEMEEYERKKNNNH
jgi:hypothetical protein|tara:strand:+ start:134 stop:382 length:249 start_codon:yes stop_codon:yes gene_type:complete